MSHHHVALEWARSTPGFTYRTYNRDHEWRFGSGASVRASAAVEYLGDPALINPEEALLAAIASCHMLSFLAVAARDGFVVDRYEDAAVCALERNAHGLMAVTRADLRPRVTFSGPRRPDRAELERMHTEAHRGCFIAHSVRTQIVVTPSF